MVMAPNLLWAADLTYINLIRRKRPGPEPRPRLRAAQKRGPPSPAPSQKCLGQRAEVNLGRDSQITPTVALPVSPPDPGAADPPRQHLYTAAAGMPPFALPPLRRAPDHPTQPHP